MMSQRSSPDAVVSGSSRSIRIPPRECAAGWNALIDPLIEICRIEGVDVSRIEERFGGLRFCPAGSGSRFLHDAIFDAERRSFRICERCGLSGRTRNYNGRSKTLCDQHDAERKSGQG